MVLWQPVRGRVLLSGSTIAGRSSEADLVLADDAVSRKHVRFFGKRGRTWLRDLGSRNGTLVNGASVERQSLKNEDEIQMGKLRIGVTLLLTARVSLAAVRGHR